MAWSALVLTQKFDDDPGRVRGSIVLLEHMVMGTHEEGHAVRS